MEKFFNTAGPSEPELNYMIDPLTRIDLSSIEALVEQRRYFVLHAPRQTGKTTALLALAHYLNAQGRYRALYVNVEVAQTARHRVPEGMAAILSVLADAEEDTFGSQTVEALRQRLVSENVNCHDWLREALRQWAQADPQRPAILFFDEVDALVGDTLISLLRQIRAGYTQRPRAFPQSIVLCGVRDVRDYRIHTAHQEIITGGSAFNIKAESLRLGNFSFEECVALWQQHTEATGQTFDEAIWPELWLDTEGQPWLVNALAHELVGKDKRLRDRSVPVRLTDYQAARERLIQSRTTHLDQLTDKLREEKVRRVVQAILSSEAVRTDSFPADDQQYCEDLGLIALRPELRIANRIYREVIPRELSWIMQTGLAERTEWYLGPDRRLAMSKLLAAFQQFFREHSEAWEAGFDYKEAGPQLLLQAFLQRIVNGGGRISREYGLGRKRTDLYLEWPLDEQQGFYGPLQRVVIELKLWKKGSLEALFEEGLPQTASYAETVGADEAHLVIFDRRSERPDWEKRIWRREANHGRWTIAVWGL